MIEFVYMSLIGIIPFLITTIYTIFFDPPKRRGKLKREKNKKYTKMLEGACIKKTGYDVQELCQVLNHQNVEKKGGTDEAT